MPNLSLPPCPKHKRATTRLTTSSSLHDLNDALESVVIPASPHINCPKQVRVHNEVLPTTGTAVICGKTSSGGYGSCFFVPPPPPNVVRVYHNRKKTAYTDHPIDMPTMQDKALPKTLLEVLTENAAPSRWKISVTVRAEETEGQHGSLKDIIERPDVHGHSPLILATRRLQVEAAAELLSLGAKVNCQDPETGCTPLILAVTVGSLPIVKELVKYRADVDFFARERSNPLSQALISRRSDIADFLLDARADLELLKERFPVLVRSYLSCRRSRVEKICCSLWLTSHMSMLLGFRWRLVLPLDPDSDSDDESFQRCKSSDTDIECT
eukprot:TRINITY_DN61911_c0_g1_i1.p1 TRINITY_DN61911_c0_g1~~TRINITY_DN61911_c0_g1_i1.p1  ORF type:complete len:326 (+),score=51.07 TRINITY_DN61911_c0_g1_i1:57-1034(+)